jgi:hypothetical protein
VVARQASGVTRVQPGEKTAGEEVRHPGTDAAGIEARVRITSGEVEIRLRPLDASGGKIIAEFNALPRDTWLIEPIVLPTIGYRLIPADKERGTPAEFRMRWVYGEEAIEGC